NAETLEEYVSEFVIRLLSRDDAAELMRDRSAPDMADLTLEAESLRRRADELAVEFADGKITAQQMTGASDRINKNLAAVQKSMAERSRSSVLGPLLASKDVRRKWESLEVDRQREVVRSVVRVIVNPTRKGSRFTPED